MMQSQHLLLLIILMPGATSVYSQKQTVVMQSTVKFDIRQATEMLNTGDKEIKGVSFYENRTPIGIKVGETIYGRIGEVVTLYPLTAYLEEYLKLKKKNKEGKRIATISPLAAAYRIEAKIYTLKGDFFFKGLTAGKYYIESVVTFPNGIGGREVSEVVAILPANDVVNIKLKHIY